MTKDEILQHVLGFTYGGMSIGELGFLYDICQNKDVLELGSMVGMSSYVIVSVAKSLHCVDVWSDIQDHLSEDLKQASVYHSLVPDLPNMLEAFKQNCKEFIDSGKLCMHIGNTREMHNSFLDETFDILLIDADHSYKGVSIDFELYKNKIKKNGCIVFHDYEDDMWKGIAQFCEEKLFNNELELTSRLERIGVFKRI